MQALGRPATPVRFQVPQWHPQRCARRARTSCPWPRVGPRPLLSEGCQCCVIPPRLHAAQRSWLKDSCAPSRVPKPPPQPPPTLVRRRGRSAQMPPPRPASLLRLGPDPFGSVHQGPSGAARPQVRRGDLGHLWPPDGRRGRPQSSHHPGGLGKYCPQYVHSDAHLTTFPQVRGLERRSWPVGRVLSPAALRPFGGRPSI